MSDVKEYLEQAKFLDLRINAKLEQLNSLKDLKQLVDIPVVVEKIAALEAEKEQIHQQMTAVTDYQKLQELGNRLEEIKDLLDEKELRWLELDEWS